MPRPPVVVVLGATGAGKSQLALELAVRFGGEVISADAMQMYKGLDVVTNKVTEEERRKVKHHCLDFLNPMDKCTVVDFRNKAVPIIDGLLSRGVLPIICGGTNYYIESLVWKVLVDQEMQTNTKRNINKDNKDEDESMLSNESLHAKLRLIDPERSSTLHPNERRKVQRSLQVYRQTGRKHSDVLKDQHHGNDQVGFCPSLRFPDCLAIWVQCDQSVLDSRCDARVDKMMQRGMMKELEEFHSKFNSARSHPEDYTVGIFQAIGFKEFHEYLALTDSSSSESLKSSALSSGVSRMKLLTRQYSRRQIKWIKNRFLSSKWKTNLKNAPKVYAVDSTHKENWKTDCYDPAVKLLESILEEEEKKSSTVESLAPLPLIDRPPPSELLRVYECELCLKSLKGLDQYEAHLAGKKHKANVKKAKMNTNAADDQRQSSSSKQFYSILIELQHSEDVDPNLGLDRLKYLRSISPSETPLHEIRSKLDQVDVGKKVDLNLNLPSESEAKNAERELNKLGLQCTTVERQ